MPFLYGDSKMKKDFDKFKKKILIEHLIYSLLLSFCVGLVIAGLTLMIIIFATKNAAIYVYPLVSAIVGLIAFAIAFSYIYKKKKPKDVDIALRVDESLGLQEKVATMIEYQDKDGLLINKQREDATEKLSKKNPKNMPIRLYVWTLPVIIISGGLFTASFFTPSANNPFVDIYKKTDVKDPSKVDENTSGIADDIKNDIDDILDADDEFNQTLDKIIDDLSKDLEGDTDTDSRQNKIDEAKNKVDIALDEVNTNEEIGAALSKDDDDILKALGEAIENDDVDGIETAFKALEEELDALPAARLAKRLSQISEKIKNILSNSGISEGSTYEILNDLANYFDEVAENINNNTTTSDEAKTNIKNKIDEAITKLKEATEKEIKHKEAAEKAKEEIDLMKDPDSQSEDSSEEETSDSSDEENEGEQDGDKNSDGSDQSSGGTKYAGDDKVYTKDGGSQEYGDIIEKSNNDANKDNEAVGGEGEDDISDILDGYYKYLYGDEDDSSNP